MAARLLGSLERHVDGPISEETTHPTSQLAGGAVEDDDHVGPNAAQESIRRTIATRGAARFANP